MEYYVLLHVTLLRAATVGWFQNRNNITQNIT